MTYDIWISGTGLATIRCMPRRRKTEGVDPRAKEIGTRIRDERETLGWNQADLMKNAQDRAIAALGAPFSQQVVSAYENGTRRPSFEEVEVLAWTLGISEVYLAGWSTLRQKLDAAEQAIISDLRALSPVQREDFRQRIHRAARPESRPNVVKFPVKK